MAKSLVLHIGDPKTGSSSIQEVLHRGLWESTSATLAYPEQLNSFPLANALSDPKQVDLRAPRWKEMATWARSSKADVAVVSAEQFFRVDPSILRATLDEFLPKHAEGARIIAYVRPHAARLVSAFMQRSKAGLYQGDMETFFVRTQRESLLQYAPRFQRWRDVFGPRFTLRPLIRGALRDGDVVSDFLDFALSGAPFKLKGAVEANPSLPLEFLVGLREVQGVLKRNQIVGGTRHSVGDHVGRSLARTRPGQGSKLKISEALYRDLKAYCKEDAAALDADFFGGQPLMMQELEKAANDVIAAGQVTQATAHFSDEAIQSLRQKARALVTHFKKRPTAWTIAFEREIGQRPPTADGKPLPPPIGVHVERVNSILTEIADLIASSSGPKPI